MKKTSKKVKKLEMEDDLKNKTKNGRRPQTKMEDELKRNAR